MNLREIAKTVMPLSDEALEEMGAICRPLHFKKGEVIIEQGKVSKEVFFICNGVARYYSLVDGDELTRWFALEGDVVASMFSFSKGLPSIGSLVAVTDLELLAAPISEVKKLLVRSHEWCRWTMEYVLDGLYVLERRHTILGQGNVMSRYLNFQKLRSYEMVKHLPLKDIASYLNMRPQTLSKVRRQIAKSGKIAK